MTEITVLTQHKEWGGRRVGGDSTGVEVEWVVVPPKGTNEWTSVEAKKITLEVRREQLATLIADAHCRDEKPPEDGVETLKKYDIALNRTGSLNSGDK